MLFHGLWRHQQKSEQGSKHVGVTLPDECFGNATRRFDERQDIGPQLWSGNDLISTRRIPVPCSYQLRSHWTISFVPEGSAGSIGADVSNIRTFGLHMLSQCMLARPTGSLPILLPLFVLELADLRFAVCSRTDSRSSAAVMRTHDHFRIVTIF